MFLRWMAGLALAGTGCAQAAPAPQFDGEAALAYVRTQLAFGPRIPGTEGHRQMGRWLDSLLRTRADTVIVQDFDHQTAEGTTLPMRNVLARFRPAAAERVLLLAHWDTRPLADAPGSRDPTAPVPGANDGASGVAVLLGVADALRAQPPPGGLGVDLLLVDGEDFGSFSDPDLADVLIGSRYYAANPPPGPRPLFAVLVDMVGDRDLQIYQEGYSVTGAPEVVERVWRTAADLGYGHIFLNEPKHSLTDDHIPLQRAGIRAIDVIDFDYPAWHTPDDTLDKVSAESLAIVGRVLLALLRR